MIDVHFKKWFKKQKLWVKGGVVGLIVGFLIYILGFAAIDNELSMFMSYIGVKPVCILVGGEKVWDCAFAFLFFGWVILPIIYGFIGTLFGILKEKFKNA